MLNLRQLNESGYSVADPNAQDLSQLTDLSFRIPPRSLGNIGEPLDYSQAERYAYEDDDDVDIDKPAGDAASPVSQEPDLPQALKLATQLTFMMLSHTLRHPFRRPSEYATPTLNPYNTVILTFLATVLREPSARSALERAIPWEELAARMLRVTRVTRRRSGG